MKNLRLLVINRVDWTSSVPIYGIISTPVVAYISSSIIHASKSKEWVGACWKGTCKKDCLVLPKNCFLFSKQNFYIGMQHSSNQKCTRILFVLFPSHTFVWLPTNKDIIGNCHGAMWISLKSSFGFWNSLNVPIVTPCFEVFGLKLRRQEIKWSQELSNYEANLDRR